MGLNFSEIIFPCDQICLSSRSFLCLRDARSSAILPAAISRQRQAGKRRDNGGATAATPVDKRLVHGTASGRNAGRARKTAAVNDRSLTDAPVVGGPIL